MEKEVVKKYLITFLGILMISLFAFNNLEIFTIYIGSAVVSIILLFVLANNLVIKEKVVDFLNEL